AEAHTHGGARARRRPRPRDDPRRLPAARRPRRGGPLGHRGRDPVRPAGARPGHRRGRRHPQLRADPRVPRGGVLPPRAPAGDRPVGRALLARADVRRPRAPARRRAARHHRGARRDAHAPAGVRVPDARRGGLPQARRDARGHGALRLQRRGDVDRVARGPRGRGRHRGGRGPPRGRAAAQDGPGAVALRVRQDADPGRGGGPHLGARAGGL
ncbi:MAG: hypothetical protein AVDCRST_MAG30-1265, partial [uncultured Solirubrobacteraceae bacterium]